MMIIGEAIIFNDEMGSVDTTAMRHIDVDVVILDDQPITGMDITTQTAL